MRKRLSDLLVVSDMDGTLLDNKKRLSGANLETIRLFTMLGGNFTLATGRSYTSVQMYNGLIKHIVPAITCGGCVIYDFKNSVPIKTSILPQVAARRALFQITQRFPRVGVMINADDMKFYQMNTSHELMKLIHDERLTFFAPPYDALPENWNKILFSGPGDELEEIQRYVQEQNYPGLVFVRTDPYYFEMLPAGVNKGSALQDLSNMLNIKLENTYAIGDYYNDIEMISSAGHGMAVRNAPDAVKSIADEVIDNNANSGVGQLLYRLIKEYA